MTTRRLIARASLEHLAPTFVAIREREGVSADRPAQVAKELSLVRQREEAGVGELDHVEGQRHDLSDLPFVTVDPVGAKDLDQAVMITRTRSGWRVRYAIADVAAHVTPGGAIDADSWRRGQTIYCPDLRVGLHPPAMSEGFASLLPGQRTKAVVWDMQVGADGSLGLHDVFRAWVRSVRQYSYDDLRAASVDGSLARGDVQAQDFAQLLGEVGAARRAAMDRAGAVSLSKPSQEITSEGGRLQLEFRAGSGIEEDNAQISLMTGIIAAKLMLEAGVGVLRTMPPASHEALARLRHQATALGIDWPPGHSYGDVLRTVDPSSGPGAAFLTAAVVLFRGARWEGFDTAAGLQVPAQHLHGALAAPYAHVTAPLRRLVDRYGTEVCLAYVSGRPTPAWVREAISGIGQTMAGSATLAGRVDRACIDAVEAAVLAPHLGKVFTGVALDNRTVQLSNPAVIARCRGSAVAGQRQRVRLVSAAVDQGAIFEVVTQQAGGVASEEDALRVQAKEA